MDLKERLDLIEKKVSPYRGGNKLVLARILDDFMDEEERQGENGENLILMDIFTDEMIDALSEDGYNREQIYPQYFFQAWIAQNDENFDHLKSCAHENGWVSVTIRESTAVPTSQEFFIRGELCLLCGLDAKTAEKENIPLSKEVQLCWTDKSASLFSSDMHWSIANRVVSAPIQCGSIHSDRFNTDISTPRLQEQNPCNAPRARGYIIQIFNVGHANTVVITQDDGKCLVVDCGIGGIQKYVDAHTYIRKNVKPTDVVITHWHRDHYKLLPELDTSELQHIIIPSTPSSNIPFGINRFLQRHKELLLDTSQMSSVKNLLYTLGYENIFMFKGEDKGNPQNPKYGNILYQRPVDDKGLIVCINQYSIYTKIIFPGDCSYYSWPDVPELNLEHTEKLLVPHHGGHIITKDFKPSQLLYQTAYISSSKNSVVDQSDSNGTTYHDTFLTNCFKCIPATKYRKFTCMQTKTKPYLEIKI